MFTITLKKILEKIQGKNIGDKYALLEWDIKNDFNTIKRTFTRKICKIYCPEILKFFELIYAKHASVFFLVIGR